MRIIQLESENVKRLSAVSITPDGDMIVIGGENGQGKSSVLDSIQMALSGGELPKMPVRRGEEKARVVVDLGDLIVTRRFTAAGGTSLVVQNKDGVKQTSPQTILDNLTGKLTFDPLEFSRQKPKEQSETLRSLVGLDFSKHDAERDQVFASRTIVNREAKALESRMASMKQHDIQYTEEQSTAAVLEQQQKAMEINSGNQKLRDQLPGLQEAIRGHQKVILDAKDEISRLTKVVVEYEAKLSGAFNQQAELKAKVDALEDADVSQFKNLMAEIETVNQQVRQNKARAEIVTQFKAKTKEADDLTAKLEHFDSDKRRKINEAKYPIEDLAFDTAGGVTYKGIPFEQCSSAEQLRVSVSIGLALNPKLRILLIRDGSLLDSESMAILAKMAADAKAQVWIERVGKDATTTVVIEDGHVAEPVTEGKAVEA